MLSLVLLARCIVLLSAFPLSNAFSTRNNKFLVSAGDEKSDSVVMLEELISEGADIMALTEEGESALHLACVWDHPQKVAVLLSAGADPNFRASQMPTSLDMTPLTWCVYGRRTDSVREMLSDPRTEVNTVVRREDGTYITALDIARRVKSTVIADMLAERGAKTYKELQDLHASNSAELRKLLPEIREDSGF